MNTNNLYSMTDIYFVAGGVAGWKNNSKTQPAFYHILLSR